MPDCHPPEHCNTRARSFRNPLYCFHGNYRSHEEGVGGQKRLVEEGGGVVVATRGVSINGGRGAQAGETCSLFRSVND